MFKNKVDKEQKENNMKNKKDVEGKKVSRKKKEGVIVSTSEVVSKVNEGSRRSIPPKNSLSDILSKRTDLKDFTPQIAVIGVGGSGGNAVNAVIEHGIKGVKTIIYNTDAQVLKGAKSQVSMQLGPKLTQGHGAGADPEVGRLAVLESEEDIKKDLEGIHVAFIVSGMGGGTGTGAGPEIGRVALDLGILTIGLVTTPFEFEGEQRRRSAKTGVEIFQQNSDVLIVISNQNLFSLSNSDTTFENAFRLTDEVLCDGLSSFIQTIKEPSRINVDVADFFTIMKGKKSRARMGTGFAEGEDRGIKAAQEAMASPLLELGGMMAKDIDGVIICIRCGRDMTLADINRAVEYIRQSVSPDANIIFGATLDDDLNGKLELSIFATTSLHEEPVQTLDQKLDSFDDTYSSDFDTTSFDELLSLKGEDLIGEPHSSAVNETADEYVVKKAPKSFFQKLWSFFFGTTKPEDNNGAIPPYMK